MLRFILPSILWTILVVVASLAPSSGLSVKEFQFEHADKIVHFMMYFFLSLFWSIGLKRQNRSLLLHRYALWFSTLGSFLLGFVLEISQEFLTLTRYFDALDLIANGIGCIFGVLMFKMIYRNSYRVD